VDDNLIITSNPLKVYEKSNIGRIYSLYDNVKEIIEPIVEEGTIEVIYKYEESPLYKSNRNINIGEIIYSIFQKYFPTYINEKEETVTVILDDIEFDIGFMTYCTFLYENCINTEGIQQKEEPVEEILFEEVGESEENKNFETNLKTIQEENKVLEETSDEEDDEVNSTDRIINLCFKGAEDASTDNTTIDDTTSDEDTTINDESEESSVKNETSDSEEEDVTSEEDEEIEKPKFQKKI
jgi:hypothetical protein